MAVQLEYTHREKTGKQAVALLRKQGGIPAILYGNGITPLAIALEEPFIRRILLSDTGKNTLLQVDIAGKTQYALIYDSVKHPITGRFQHIDFLCVDKTKPVTLSVPFKFTGTPKGVKVGGLLLPIITQATVTCLPFDIPSVLPLDITPVGLGQSLKIGDIIIPDTLVITNKPSQVVVKVSAPKGTKAADIAKVA